MVRATDDKLVVQRARKILIPTSTFSLGALEVFTANVYNFHTCDESVRTELHPDPEVVHPKLLHQIVVQHGR